MRTGASGTHDTDSTQVWGTDHSSFRLLVAARSVILSVAIWTLLVDRRKFKKYRFAVGGVGVLAGQTVWKLRRARQFGFTHDRLAVLSDAMATSISTTLCSFATRSEDQVDVIANWAFAATLWNATSYADVLGVPLGMSVAGGTMLAYFIPVIFNGGRKVISPALVQISQIGGFAVAGGFVFHWLRKSEREAAEARTGAIALQAAIARDREEETLQRTIVDAALSASEEVGALLATNRPAAQRRAATIAARLRAALSVPDEHPARELLDQLHSVVVECSGLGLATIFTHSIDHIPEPQLFQSVVAVTRYMLNSAITSGNTEVVLRVSEVADVFMVTVRFGSGLNAIDVDQLVALSARSQGEVIVESPAVGETRARVRFPR